MINISVENIRCGGCAATISDKLRKNHQLSRVDVDVNTGSISIDDVDEKTKLAVITTLKKIGYPLVNSTSGWHQKKTQARSLLSCAIGKLK